MFSLYMCSKDGFLQSLQVYVLFLRFFFEILFLAALAETSVSASFSFVDKDTSILLVYSMFQDVIRRLLFVYSLILSCLLLFLVSVSVFSRPF